MNIYAIVIKSTIEGLKASAEHAMMRCGIKKQTAMIATLRFEAVNGGLVEFLEAQFSDGHGLSAIEQAALITTVEIALSAGLAATVFSGAGAVVVGGVGVGVAIAVGLFRDKLLAWYADWKEKADEAFPLVKVCNPNWYYGSSLSDPPSPARVDPLIVAWILQVAKCSSLAAPFIQIQSFKRPCL